MKGDMGMKGEVGFTDTVGAKGERGEKGEPGDRGSGSQVTLAGLITWNQCSWTNLNDGKNYGQLVVSCFSLEKVQSVSC